MRKDVFETIRELTKHNPGMKVNYAEIARRMNCDYRTAKKYYERKEESIIEKKQKPSKLDGFKEIINEKVEIGCTASSIYHYLIHRRFNPYKGKYTILREYVKSIKDNETKKATIRFETNPGLQGQVDWKESKKMISKDGTVYEVNIFLMLLGYSRVKYIQLTLDRNQDTLMTAMIEGFKYFGGVPKEIIFDNMKTVVDQARTYNQEAKINETFYQFSKDMGFEVWSCRSYRPQTKGKVEALAKLTSRLDPYNYEFSTIDELDEIVSKVMDEINDEISLATNKVPSILLKKEREYLLPIPNQDLINNYFTKPITRVVTKESMITYKSNKYSLNPKYIGKTVVLVVSDNTLHIILDKEIISSHKLSHRKFNYKEDDMKAILKSDVLRFKRDEEIEVFARNQLSKYDDF